MHAPRLPGALHRPRLSWLAATREEDVALLPGVVPAGLPPPPPAQARALGEEGDAVMVNVEEERAVVLASTTPKAAEVLPDSQEGK